jgi:glutamyl-tRNA reductase
LKVQVTYCNHETAALDVRERLAFASQDQLVRAYDRLRENFPQSELVVLSTCNRVELYTAQEDPQSAPSPRQIAQFFADFHAIPLDQFADDLLAQSGAEAVRHLFQVVSSLDSMVLGEPQIVSQVKDAYRIAQENDACGPLTHHLFEAAIRVSRRVRSETRLSEGRVSVASVAVGEFGKSIFDHFRDKQVLVIGAGEMAEETLRYLKDEGVRHIVVANRNLERARELAYAWGGRVEPFEDLDRLMAEADVIVSTTGSDRPIVDAPRFAKIREKTDNKPVFILDLGAPRDFDPAVGNLDENVFLYDIDDLEETCRRNRQTRQREVERAMAIVNEETAGFMHDLYHRATGPIIKRLREEWHEIRQAEVRQLFARMNHFDERDRVAIEKTIEQIINKLLHPPLEALRDEARQGTPHGLLDAIKRLFHLSD